MNICLAAIPFKNSFGKFWGLNSHFVESLTFEILHNSSRMLFVSATAFLPACVIFEHDLTVDVNGNPHLLTTVCNGNNAYAVFFASWHHMFDITQLNGVWNAVDIANVQAGRGTWSVTPNVSTMDMAPQVARTADGKKLFYTWSDYSTYTAGQANQSPNMFSKAFDVVANKWTPLKDFTSCNAAIAGKILFPHVAEEVLEPTATSYKFASVYGEFTVVNDPGQGTK